MITSTPKTPGAVSAGVKRDTATEPLFELFHANTRYTRAQSLTHALRIARHLGSRTAVEAASRNYKVYRFADRQPLPAPRPLGMPIADALRRRVSIRSFSEEPMSVQSLADILIPAAACNRKATSKAFPHVELRFRSYPSAGAEYPLEIYPVLMRVADAPVSVTHFDPRECTLSVLTSPLSREAVQKALMQAESVLDNAAVLLVITAVFARTTEKYGDRGYRLILLEAGHLAQNLCLCATAAGHGSLAWGGFYDDELNRLIGVDGVTESVLHALFVGTAGGRQNVASGSEAP